MAWLKLSIAADPEKRADARKSTAFDALLDRPEFRQLVGEK
jgi:hypothetical protein